MQGRKSELASKTDYNNENQFNNFGLSSPRSRAQLDFSLHTPRSKSSMTKLDVANPEKKK